MIKDIKNILRLSSAVNLLTENGEKENVLTLEELKKYLGHLVLITPSNLHSELKMIQTNNPKMGANIVRNYLITYQLLLHYI